MLGLSTIRIQIEMTAPKRMQSNRSGANLAHANTQEVALYFYCRQGLITFPIRRRQSGSA
jgi:hypothetical protein